MDNFLILKNNIGTFGKYLMDFNILTTIVLLNLDPSSYLLNSIFSFFFASATIIPFLFRPLEKEIHTYKNLYINYVVYPSFIILTISWIGLIIFPNQDLNNMPLEFKKITLYAIYILNLFTLFIYYLNVYFKYMGVNQYRRILYEIFIIIIFIIFCYSKLNFLL